MKQGPFLLGLCHKGAFTDFLRFFSFCCFFEPVAESCMWPPAHKWDKPSPTAGKPGRMVYLPDQMGLARRINHTSLQVVCPVSRFRRYFLSLCLFFFLWISLWSFLSNLPLLPFTSIFTPFSSRISQSFSFWAQFRDLTGMQGQASCCLEKSPALRVVFFRKTLHPLIPTFLSTRNENDRCDRKTH